MRKWTLAGVASAVLLAGAVTLAQRGEGVGEEPGPIAEPRGADDFIQAEEYLINPDQIAYIRFESDGELAVSVSFAGGGEPLELSGEAAKQVASQVRPLVDMPQPDGPPADVEPTPEPR